MPDRRIQRRRNAPAQHGQRSDILGDELRDDRLRRRTAVGWLAGEHLVGHRTERVDVGATIDGAIPCGLLRAHVLWRAEREAGLGDALPAGVADRECDAEVGHQRLAVGEEDVLGLEVAMDDATAVRVVERLRNGDRETHGFVHGQLLLAVEPRAERFTFDERHDVKQQPLRLTAVEERQEVRMLQVGRDPDLGQEAFDAEHGAEFRVEHLDGDRAVVADVVRQVDRGHAAGANLAVKSVAIVQRRREPVHGVTHVACGAVAIMRLRAGEAWRRSVLHDAERNDSHRGGNRHASLH